MMRNRFMLTLFLAAQVGGSSLIAQNESGVLRREVNQKGWAVPGIRDLNQLKVYNLNEEIIEGIPVQVSSIAPVNVYGDKDSELANRILRYAINVKPFCYIASLSVYRYDKNSKAGGIPGDEFYRAYYDEDGDGIFETREDLRPPVVWRPHLSDWVKKAIQNQ
jgi:hypothetical protein